MKCINCGNEVESGVAYCPHCGKRPDKKSYRLLVIIQAVLVVCLLFFFLRGKADSGHYHLEVRAEKVKVRSGADDSYDHVGYIYQDEIIDVISVVKGSGKTYYQIGENAFVASEDRNLKVVECDECSAHPYIAMTKLSSMDIGSKLNFGEYEGKELSWLVCENTGKEMLLVSAEVIDYRPFDVVFKTWADSNIRSWLNNEFLSSFDKAEIQAIINVVNNTERNNEESTVDRAFLLSESEVELYLSNNSLRLADASQNAINNGAEVKNGSCPYFLRTLNGDDQKVLIVKSSGDIAYNSHTVEDACGIRPAIWVRISK